MHQRGTRHSQKLVDDGIGSVKIWRIENFAMMPLDERLYGQFFGGDSYVILYTYTVNRKENYIVYFWQGQVRVTDSIKQSTYAQGSSQIMHNHVKNLFE